MSEKNLPRPDQEALTPDERLELSGDIGEEVVGNVVNLQSDKDGEDGEGGGLDSSPFKLTRAKKATAFGLAGAMTLAGPSAAVFAETGDGAPIDAAQRIMQISDMPANPMEEALETGKVTFDLGEQAGPMYEYEAGAFSYSPETTCHARDAEWLEAHGLPKAYIMFVYDRAGLDRETATTEQKIEAFKDAMLDCYTKDPYVFAGNKLVLDHSADGEVVNQDMINALGDAYVANPGQWQTDFESHMQAFESSENTCGIGFAEAGTHFTTYTSDADNENGHFGIYMGGPSRISTETITIKLSNGQTMTLKECLQPAWTTGTPYEIPGGPVDLPPIDIDLCEPIPPVVETPPESTPAEPSVPETGDPVGGPVIVPPLPYARLETPRLGTVPPRVDQPPTPLVPPRSEPPVGALPPDYAALTGAGIDKKATVRSAKKGYSTDGYVSVARNHKQPTRLNDGGFGGNRNGRGRTKQVRTPNARRGR